MTHAILYLTCRFAVPALALYLVNPSLSLIDTALIGQFDSTHLASLAPSTMLLDYPAYLLTLLGISTQNLVATELGKNNVDAASEALSDGMSIALGVGFLMCGLSALLVKPLLEIICSGSSVSLIAPAVQYVNIRSTTWPAVTITSVLQSTLLARGDVINPVKAAWASALVNLVLDWLLIGRYGIAGAAVATVATQLLVLVMQARALDLGYRFKRVSAARAQEFVALAGPVGLTNGMKVLLLSLTQLSPPENHPDSRSYCRRR
jgi:Na+-driven multidrug efflux pump